MSYDTEVLKVCRLENGFEVEVYEPSPPKKESKEEVKARMDGCCGHVPSPYEEPWKSYAFETVETTLAFISTKLPLARRKGADDEYQDTFKEATK